MNDSPGSQKTCSSIANEMLKSQYDQLWKSLRVLSAARQKVDDRYSNLSTMVLAGLLTLLAASVSDVLIPVPIAQKIVIFSNVIGVMM